MASNEAVVLRKLEELVEAAMKADRNSLFDLLLRYENSQDVIENVKERRCVVELTPLPKNVVDKYLLKKDGKKRKKRRRMKIRP